MTLTPLQYAAKELGGLTELSKLSKEDREVIKRWAEEEMVALGIAVAKA